MDYEIFEIPTKINTYWIYNTKEEKFVMKGNKRLEFTLLEAKKYVGKEKYCYR